MKTVLIAITILFSTVSFAQESARCFATAYGHPSKGGFGMINILAQELCAGATNATEVLNCYVVAYGHPSKGGLGLPAQFAVDLCARTTNAPETIECWNQMGRSGAIVQTALDVCKSK